MLVYKLNDDNLDMIKDIIRPGSYVSTIRGFARVIKCTPDNLFVMILGGNDLLQLTYSEVVPILKGFEHLLMSDAYAICDIITGNFDKVEYKPNFNFFPSYIEITEEVNKIKIQIFNSFDILYCDNLLTHAPAAFSYMKRRGYDIGGLSKHGLAIIDPTPYGLEFKR